MPLLVEVPTSEIMTYMKKTLNGLHIILNMYPSDAKLENQRKVRVQIS